MQYPCPSSISVEIFSYTTGKRLRPPVFSMSLVADLLGFQSSNELLVHLNKEQGFVSKTFGQRVTVYVV